MESSYKPFNSTLKSIFTHQPMPMMESPAIMESIDSPQILAGLEDDSHKNLPDITLTSDFVSLKLGSVINENSNSSFLLLDSNEFLKVSSGNEFLIRLGCEEHCKVKVVSIFGNTGDGKSFTLNQTFFNGVEVFRTSDEQDACTLGVWAAFNPSYSVICLDTEGLLGTCSHENQRIRMLLKVLAISDVIIFRSRAERLHTDMFTFLGSASRAYTNHFQSSLLSVGNKAEFGGPLSALGPAVVIFHETRHTSPLTKSGINPAEGIIRSKFGQMKLEIDAFSSLNYIGVQTVEPPTNFSSFKKAIKSLLDNSSVRSPRSPLVVFNTLKLLNDKFCEDISKSIHLFPDEYFTCQSICLSCGSRCQSSMGHLAQSPHNSSNKCRYQHQFENITYTCKACYKMGRDVKVVPTYTSSNSSSWLSFAKYACYVIECPNCGEIYRSRQFWYGNESPEVAAVRTDIQHVWPGVECAGQNCINSAQMVVDKVTDFSEAIASVTAQPTKIISQWAADQIAPAYWRPNEEIKVCIVCADEFGSDTLKHHCRSCGEGVCEKCSSRSRTVPERGWHKPVRVCDKCISPHTDAVQENDGNPEVTARKVGEAVVTGFSSVASLLHYPRSFIKNSVRPGYWVPDRDARNCCVCGADFGRSGTVHHCRDCGGTVCTKCSRGRALVPHRGWTTPVRVCDSCLQNITNLTGHHS